MKTTRHPRQWVEPFALSFLVVTPLLLVIMGLLCITALGAGPTAAGGGTPLPIDPDDTRLPSGESRSCTHRGSFGLSLDPGNHLNLFLLLPALSGLATFTGALIVWTLTRWQPPDRRPGGRISWMRVGLLGLVWWLALSILLIFDLLGAASLHLGFVAVFALCWSLAGLLLLHQRPGREKVLVLVLFLALLSSIRFIDWNSRKPFLKDFDRVQVGMTETEADQIMAGYLRGVSPLATVDRRGEVQSGVVAYRHTTESWGNSDVGILTFENRRVAATQFLPD